MKFFDSPSVKCIINKILLAFIFYTVAAASFNGFFVKWTFRDTSDKGYSFAAMYDETAKRPFVHRQLMLIIAKEIKSKMSNETQQDLMKFFKRQDAKTRSSEKNFFIEHYYANTKIEPHFALEYHIVYFLAFTFLFLSMFIIRQIGIEITKNPTAGTLTACVFTIILPILETVGGYFYDFGEIFFLSLATLLAIKGYWLVLILISPIAEYNKESYLFFVATLFPLLSAKLGNKKTFLAITAAIFLSGINYLIVSKIYSANGGGATEFHLWHHIEFIFHYWLSLEITYGIFFGAGMFFPHILLIAWLVKCTWKKLSLMWKNHIKIAAIINFPLYLLFCFPNEIRNFSLLYVSLIAMLSIFIKEAIISEQRT